MADAKNMKEYHGQIQEALDDKFLRATLDKFAVEYKANRVRIFEGMDVDKLVSEVADIKDNAAQHMMELYEQFKTEAEKRGVHVHFASTGAEANRGETFWTGWFMRLTRNMPNAPQLSTTSTKNGIVC